MLPGHSRRMVARGCVLVPSASAQIQPLGRETTAAPIALPAKQPIAGFRSGRGKIVQQSKGALPGSWNGSYYNQLQIYSLRTNASRAPTLLAVSAVGWGFRLLILHSRKASFRQLGWFRRI